MAFTMFGRTIRKIGVIGSGNIGPDIALHFSQNLLCLRRPCCRGRYYSGRPGRRVEEG